MLRLSEAMRLGSMLRPQLFCALHSEEGSCAAGAALEAVGGLRAKSFGSIWPWTKIQDPALRCPDVCSFTDLVGEPLCVIDLIVHLNDHHGWTRERIADWVATVEPPEEQLVENTKKEEVPACC